jgi:chloride channel protein, CIC family
MVSANDRPANWVDYARLAILGAAVGIPAALVAALFLAFVHELQHWLWTDLPDALGGTSPQWYLVVGLPVVGAAIVVIARAFLPGDGGSLPIKGLHHDPPLISHGPGILLAAVATLGFGAVLGPEAPVIALGAVVALAVTAFLRLPEQASRVIGTSGSFAAISALFGGPIVAGVLMVEGGIGLGARLIPALLPGFVAAAVGYVIFLGFGNWQGLHAPGLTVPNLEVYNSSQVRDLFIAVAVGIATALVLAGVRAFAIWIGGEGGRRLSMPAFLLGGGLIVGLVALLARGLGANSQDVLFSGQASIPALVAEGSTGVLLVLVLAKAVAYGISLVCGFRGGPIFPAVFLGIGVAMLPVVWFHASPTLAVAIGTAAGTAAQTRLVLASILFAAILVGSNGLETGSAAVLAAVAAWLTVTALGERGVAAEEEPAPA